MKFLPWFSLPLITLYFPFAALAQVPVNPESPAISSTTTSLLIPPRFSVDYNSSGGGYDGFGGLEFMLPVQQEPGQRLDYLLGRVNVTNGADVGGNLLFGTRSLNKCWAGQGNCFIGGYVGLDLTNTGEALFPQLGLGLEMLGDVELRLNGYMALGDSRRLVQVGEFVSPTGIQFQGRNLLLVDANHSNRFQNALSGFDLEVGGKIAQLGQGGDLHGYGGVYSYGGVGIERYWGGRFRLEVRPNNVLSIGAGVQFDPEFGSNLLFRVAASFPSLAQRQSRVGNAKLEQFAQPPLRQNSVVVAQRVEPARGPILVDPVSGQPYEFIHVSPNRGSQGGNGSAESPTTTIQKATALATPTTDVIYVQSGNAGGGFTIPDGVAVLSVAPVQLIATQFGQVPLPGSGQGEAARPVISDTVTMGNDTKLSGFEIQPPVNRSGVVAENVRNIEIASNHISVTNQLSNIRDLSFSYYPTDSDYIWGILARNMTNLGGVMITSNLVTTSGDRANGIDAKSGQGGNIIIADNIVTVNSTRAIGIQGMSGSSLYDAVSDSSSVIISGNRVIHSGNGTQGFRYIPSEFSTGITGGSNGNTMIFDNMVSMSGSNSSGLSGSSASNLIIAGNIVTSTGDNSGGISGYSNRGISGGGHGRITIADNVVSISGGATLYSIYPVFGKLNGSGISFQIIDIFPNNYYSGQDRTLTITGNTITTAGDSSNGIDGYIDYIGEGFNSRSIITGNTITTRGNDSNAISIRSFPINVNHFIAITITNNRIHTDGFSSNGFDGSLSGGIYKAAITNNIIDRSGGDGVRLSGDFVNSLSCVVLSNNISRNSASGIGYHLINFEATNPTFIPTFQIADTSPVFANTQANNIGTFVFEPNITSFTNIPACP